MNFKLLSLLALASFVVAQDGPSSSDAGTDSGIAAPTDTAGATPSASGATPSGTDLPPCINACVNQAAQRAGCTPTSPACMCGAAFMSAVQQCASSCSASDQQTALGLAQQVCGGAVSASGSSGAVSGTSASVSASGSATILPTGVTSAGLPRPTISTRPLSTSGTSTRGTATGAPASTTSTGGATTNAATQGLWALAAGAIGIAVAF